MKLRCLALALMAAGLMPAQKLSNPFFVFENGAGRDQKAPLEEQALESRGLKMFSIYVAVRLDGDRAGYDAALPEAIRQLKGHGTAIWLTVQGTAKDGEERRNTKGAGTG